MTFKRGLIKANANGNAGEKTRPVNAPSMNKLVLVNSIIQTKINQVTANTNPQIHKPPKAKSTGTNVVTIAQIKRPI